MWWLVIGARDLSLGSSATCLQLSLLLDVDVTRAHLDCLIE